ncbi:RTA1-domain-containing protein [Hypoxylon sp. FL1284]|nr:RTA1-domain-containing protein [Hypoxylon sp. FL1284]
MDSCTPATCDVATSWYGYQPNLGINIFFAIIYSLAALWCFILAVWKRTWLIYTITILVGALLELVGYAARIKGHYDPWLGTGWIIQYAIITLAPVFMTAAVYVCIGRIAEIVGHGVFNINPKLYSRVFIPNDVLALIVQAAGGAISVSEPVTTEGVTPGAAVVIAGLVYQVVSLTVFFVLFTAVLWPANVFNVKASRLPPRQAKSLRNFIICIITAVLLIIGRSAFRVAELSQGVRGGLVHDELLFIIFDSFPVAIATIIITVVHPVFMLRFKTEHKHMSAGSQGVELMPPASTEAGKPVQ